MTNSPDDRAGDTGISVIMPVYNGIGFIEKSLPPLMAMCERGEILEVILIDDSSTDKTIEVAREHGATILSSGGRLGPSAARNQAADQARGGILWFVDADVVVHEDAARVLATGFASRDVVAIFGSYDDEPPAQNFLSQYKNLVHHFYHQRAREEASTFWSGCGAVSKEAFLARGGFDVEMFQHPSVEDIELGYRLRAAGGRIALLHDLQCTHLKEWRFVNLIHTEVVRRAIPWSRLMLRREGLTDDLNVGTAERVRAGLAGLFVLSLFGLLVGMLPGMVVLAMLLVVVAANWEITRLFFLRKGVLFALAGLAFHQLYYLYSTFAFCFAFIERLWVREPQPSIEANK